MQTNPQKYKHKKLTLVKVNIKLQKPWFSHFLRHLAKKCKPIHTNLKPSMGRHNVSSCTKLSLHARELK